MIYEHIFYRRVKRATKNAELGHAILTDTVVNEI